MASLLRSLVLLMLIVLVLQDVEGWRRRRRRRRRGCVPSNCQVGQWSGWSSCSHRCGYAGTQYRTRAKTVSERCGARCTHSLRQTRACNRNACQNGGSPANGYCRCRPGFQGTCCEIGSTTISIPVTTLSTTRRPLTTSLPCFCYNGGSPVCRFGRLRYCVCFTGCSGRLCQRCPSTRRSFTRFTTRRPFTRPSTRRSFTRFTTRRPFTPLSTTRRPLTTSLPCFCYNGGSPVCRFGRLRYCVCFRGCSGRLCQRCPSTRRPFTRFTTRRPFTRSSGSLRCYSCKTTSAKDCSSRITTCRRRNEVCYFGYYTKPRSSQRFYTAGCATQSVCRSACEIARRKGAVAQCLLKCCSTNLCNDIRNLKRKTSEMLSILLKLLKGFKNILGAITAMIKAHLSRQVASLHKREIVSMMGQVDDAARQIEDSREPEALWAKRDVAETRMRAQELLKKLDSYIE